MPNIQLMNDDVETITILVLDGAGAMVPAPAGDTFFANSSSPSLGAVISKDTNGNPAVTINGMVQESPGLWFTVSDSAGLTVVKEFVDIVQDLAPKALSLDLATATHTPQAVPTAPGP